MTLELPGGFFDVVDFEFHGEAKRDSVGVVAAAKSAFRGVGAIPDPEVERAGHGNDGVIVAVAVFDFQAECIAIEGDGFFDVFDDFGDACEMSDHGLVFLDG